MKNKYIPLTAKTQGSILYSQTNPKKLVEFAVKNGFESVGICDIDSLSQVFDYWEACNENDIKPIIGLQIRICDKPPEVKIDNPSNKRLIFIARNLNGWKKLLEILYISNKPEYYDGGGRLDVQTVCGLISEDIITIYHSDLTRAEIKAVCKASTYSFGGHNPIEGLPAEPQSEYRVPIFPNYYLEKSDKKVNDLLLCKMFGNITIDKATPDIHPAFDSEYYCFQCQPEKYRSIDGDIIENTQQVFKLIEKFDISIPAQFVSVECPDGMNEDKYLRHKCWQGMKQFGIDKNEKYLERIKYELDVIKDAEMSGYFLIMSDITDFCKDNGIKVGQSRGCLMGSTPILTQDGFKQLKNVATGDSVVSESGKFNKVLQTQSYETYESLLNIKCFFGDSEGVSLTKDHKILAIKSKERDIYKRTPHKDKIRRFEHINPDKPGLSWLRADELKEGDWVFIPKTRRPIINYEKIDLFKYCDGKRLVQDGPATVSHIHANGRPRMVRSIRQFGRYIPIDNDFCWLLGLFCGDGWLKKDDKSRIGLAFHSQDNLQSLKRAREYFKKIGIKTSEIKHKSKKLIQLYAMSPFFYEVLKELFLEYKRTSGTKHIPFQIKHMDDDLIYSFLDGLIDSDGHVSESRKKTTISSTSKKIKYQIKELCNILNIPCRTATSERMDKRTNRKWQEHRIDLLRPYLERKCSKKFYKTDAGQLLKIRKIETVVGDGTVYDLTIENESNYSTSSFLVHNSAGGCLISYLIGITGVDPIKHDLIFERFYSPSRKGYPDIDVDFQPSRRDEVVDYLISKYGADRFMQLSTFGTLKGKSALKVAMQGSDKKIEAQLQNEISKSLLDETRLASELEEQYNSIGTKSSILYCLQNDGQKLEKWCRIDSNGDFVGQYSDEFEQAVELNSIIVNRGRHASAFVLGQEPLYKTVPVVYDEKSKKYVIAVDMNVAERMGCIKLDLLGLRLLDEHIYAMEVLNGKQKVQRIDGWRPIQI